MDHLRRLQQCCRLFDILRFLDDDKKSLVGVICQMKEKMEKRPVGLIVLLTKLFFLPGHIVPEIPGIVGSKLRRESSSSEKRSTYFEIINGFGASGSKYFKRQHLGETLRCGRGLNLSISNTIKDEKSVLKSIKSWNNMIGGCQN